MVIVDYVDKIDERGDDIRSRISAAAERMKRIAERENVALVLLSQLSRRVESRPNPKPTNADLKESGKLEEEADHIIFPFRPWVYDKKAHDPTTAEILVTKNRGGPIGTFPAYFVGKYFRFLDRDPHGSLQWRGS